MIFVVKASNLWEYKILEFEIALIVAEIASMANRRVLITVLQTRH